MLLQIIWKVKILLRINPKYFFKLVNSKRKVCSVPYLLLYIIAWISGDDREISNIFGEFFHCYFATDSYAAISNYSYRINDYNEVANVMISDQRLRSLKPSYMSEPNGIPSCILMSCVEELSFVISNIFNCSLRTGLSSLQLVENCSWVAYQNFLVFAIKTSINC